MNMKRFCWLLLLLLSIELIPNLKGQTTESPALKVSAKVSAPTGTKRNDYLSKMVYAAVSGDTLWKQLANMDELKGVMNDLVTKEKMPLMGEFSKADKWLQQVKNLKKIYTSTVVNTSYYATNAVDTTPPVRGIAPLPSDFMNVNLALNLNLGGLPFSLQSSVVLENGVFKSDFSYTHLQFDVNKYKQDWQSKLSQKQLEKTFNFDGITEGVKLNRLDSSVLSRDMAFTLYSGVMNNPKVGQLREQLLVKIDSVKTKYLREFLPKGDSLKLDSLKNIPLTDTAFWQSKLTRVAQKEVDSLAKKQVVLNQVLSKYDSLWEKRKGDRQKLEALRSKFSNLEANMKKYENVDSLTKELLKSEGLKWKDKVMLKVKGLETGQFGVDEHEFLLKNQLLNGFKLDYQDKKREWGIIIGQSRLQALNAPIFYNPFQRLTLGRSVMMLKMSQLLRDSSKLTFRLMNVHKTQDSLFQGSLTPNYNSVLGIGYDRKLSKNWGFETDIAFSNVRETAIISNENAQATPLSNRHWAASTQVNWQRFEALSLGLGYYYVGNGFYTFGNDFLINNRNGIKANLKSSLFKQKIKLDIEFKRGVLNAPQQVGLSQSALMQMRGSIAWLFGKNQSLQFQYMPNTMTERQVKSDGRGFDYTTNIYLVVGNFNYNVGKMTQKTLVMLSNVNQQIDFFDSIKVAKTSYVSLRHEAVLGKTSSIIFKMNGGLSALGEVQTGQIQGDARFLVAKKCQLTLGLQRIKKRIEPSWRTGIVGQMNLKLSDKLVARAGIIYRGKNKEKGILTDEWIGNAALTMQF